MSSLADKRQIEIHYIYIYLETNKYDIYVTER